MVLIQMVSHEKYLSVTWRLRLPVVDIMDSSSVLICDRRVSCPSARASSAVPPVCWPGKQPGELEYHLGYPEYHLEYPGYHLNHLNITWSGKLPSKLCQPVEYHLKFTWVF